MNKSPNNPEFYLDFFGSTTSDDVRKKNKELRREKHSDCKVTRDILKIANRISSKLEHASSDSSLFIDSDRDNVTKLMSKVSQTAAQKMDPRSVSECSDIELSQSLLTGKRQKKNKKVKYLKDLNRSEVSPQKENGLDISTELLSPNEDPSNISGIAKIKQFSPPLNTSGKKKCKSPRKFARIEVDGIKRELILTDQHSQNASAVSKSGHGIGVLDRTESSRASDRQQSNFYEDIKDNELWIIQAPANYDVSQLSNEILAYSGIQQLRGSKQDGCCYEVHTTGGSFTQKLHPFLPSKQTDGLVAAQILSGQLQVVQRIDIPHLPVVAVPPAKKHVMPSKLLKMRQPFGSRSPLREDTDNQKTVFKKKKQKHGSPLQDDTDDRKIVHKKKKRKNESLEIEQYDDAEQNVCRKKKHKKESLEIEQYDDAEQNVCKKKKHKTESLEIEQYDDAEQNVCKKKKHKTESLEIEQYDEDEQNACRKKKHKTEKKKKKDKKKRES